MNLGIMAKALRILPLVLLVVGVLWSPSSSLAQKTNDDACSNYFEYLNETASGPFIGRITLPNLTKGITQLKVQLSQREPISSNNYGLSLFFSNIDTVQSIKYGKPVSYRLDFPDPTKPPKIMNINVNDFNICSDITYSGETIVVNMKHTLNYKLLKRKPFTSSLQETRKRFKRQATTTVLPPFEDTPNNQQQENITPTCGREGAKLDIQPFVYGGINTQRGQFPWLTAIFKTEIEDLQFLCGGSLISTSVVVSAAHCFRYPKPLEAQQIVVFLGRHNLENDKENFEKRELESLHIHPDFNIELFADADIAILKLILPVILNEFIQPICLWSESSDLSHIVGQQGAVVGWGADETGRSLSNVPKMVNTSIVSEITCRLSNPHFDKLTSSRSFCAGYRDNKGPCTGDSGSGLMIKRDGYWTIRGIVSLSLSKEGKCLLDHYVIYCDLADHIQWVKEIAFPTTTKNKHPSFTSPRFSPNQPQPIPEKQHINEICGHEGAKSVSTQLIQTNSTKVIRGQFPWLAAVLQKLNANREIFQCGGSLISTRIVLTSAKCFQYVPAHQIVVILGSRNIIDFEPTETRAIETLHIHPGYDVNALHDSIAIIELLSPVSFNQFIQPICLWNESEDAALFGNETGMMVGWDMRYDTNDISPVPDRVNCSVMNEEQCKMFHDSINEEASTDSFCVKNPNGPILRRGGNAFMIKRDGRWVLRGIGSAGLTLVNSTNSVLVPRLGYGINCDVAKHIQWIKEITFQQQSSKTNKGLTVTPPQFEGTSNTQQSLTAEQNISAICGRDVENSDSEELLREQFPWLAAILKDTFEGQKFICGGSLISTRTVISAAHCFESLEEEYVVYLGRHKLFDLSFTENFVTSGIKTLLIHPEFKGGTIADADIALLQLKRPVRFNQLIQPICLWTETDGATLLGNETGVMVGWDTDDDILSAVRKKVNVHIIDETLCRNVYNTSKPISTRPFCGISPFGTVFRNDGYGLIIRRDGRWMLRGIKMSGMTFATAEDKSDKGGFAFFSDVAKHIQWIQNNTLSL